MTERERLTFHRRRREELRLVVTWSLVSPSVPDSRAVSPDAAPNEPVTQHMGTAAAAVSVVMSRPGWAGSDAVVWRGRRPSARGHRRDSERSAQALAHGLTVRQSQSQASAANPADIEEDLNGYTRRASSAFRCRALHIHSATLLESKKQSSPFSGDHKVKRVAVSFSVSEIHCGDSACCCAFAQLKDWITYFICLVRLSPAAIATRSELECVTTLNYRHLPPHIPNATTTTTAMHITAPPHSLSLSPSPSLRPSRSHPAPFALYHLPVAGS